MERVFSLYDKVSETYFSPFIAPNAAAACRSVTTAALMDNTIVSQHPSDFTLYEVGEWTHLHGVISGYDNPRIVAQVGSLVRAAAEMIPAQQKGDLIAHE